MFHLAVTVGSPIVPVLLAGSGCFRILVLHMPAQVQYFPDAWVDLLSLALDDTTDPLASACRICLSRACWKLAWPPFLPPPQQKIRAPPSVSMASF